MHMHVNYIDTMRTTVDIPGRLRQKLIAEATTKNLKGFSSIIVQALEEYFDKHEKTTAQQEIQKLRGSISREEYEREMEMLQRGRNQWRM